MTFSIIKFDVGINLHREKLILGSHCVFVIIPVHKTLIKEYFLEVFTMKQTVAIKSRTFVFNIAVFN